MRIIEAPEVVEPAIGSVVLDSAGLAWQSCAEESHGRRVWYAAQPLVQTWKFSFAMLLIECGPLRLIHDAGNEPVEVDARPSLADRLDRLPTS